MPKENKQAAMLAKPKAAPSKTTDSNFKFSDANKQMAQIKKQGGNANKTRGSNEVLQMISQFMTTILPLLNKLLSSIDPAGEPAQKASNGAGVKSAIVGAQPNMAQALQTQAANSAVKPSSVDHSTHMNNATAIQGTASGDHSGHGSTNFKALYDDIADATGFDMRKEISALISEVRNPGNYMAHAEKSAAFRVGMQDIGAALYEGPMTDLIKSDDPAKHADAQPGLKVGLQFKLNLDGRA